MYKYTSASGITHINISCIYTISEFFRHCQFQIFGLRFFKYENNPILAFPECIFHFFLNQYWLPENNFFVNKNQWYLLAFVLCTVCWTSWKIGPKNHIYVLKIGILAQNFINFRLELKKQWANIDFLRKIAC